MDDILKQLDKFKNNKLEKSKVKKAVSQYIDSKADDFTILNIINLIMNYVTLLETLEEDSVKTILEQDIVLNNLLNKLKGMVNSLKKVLQGDTSKVIESLCCDRKYFEGKVKVLVGYNDEIEALEILLNKMKYKYRKDLNVNVEILTGEIINKIFKDKDPIVINDKIKTVFKSIPLKITRNKFYDYIESSLSIYYCGNVEDLDDFIQMLKESYEPDIIDCYGEECPFVLDKIKNIKERISNTNELTTKRLLKELDYETEKLEIILDISNLSVELINSLLVIIYNENVSIEHLVLKEPRVSSVFTILSIISEMDRFIISDSILENLYKLEGAMEKYIFEADKEVVYIDEISEKYKEQIIELELESKFEKLRKSKLLNESSLYGDLDLNSLEQCNVQIDKKHLHNKTMEFINFIDEKSENMPVDLRKAKMNQLMCLLPVVFKKPKELYDFIYNLLERASNDYEIYYTKEMIKQIL